MSMKIFPISFLLGLLLSLAACNSGAGSSGSGQTLKGWDLSPSDHKEVMGLVRKIYESGVSGRIVAWYETEGRGYFDLQGRGFVEFNRPIKTLSVAIPDYVSHIDNVQSKLDHLASTTSHNGWRLKKFRVQIDPHGAGGGPSGSFDKVTIYPIEVVKSR